MARFNDVHAFGYNFAGSERIWMNFEELRVYCLMLALTDFGHDPHRSESGRPCGSFVFLVVTIIFVVSVCLSVCLFVCLFVCAEFFSAVFDPISINLGHMLYVWV